MEPQIELYINLSLANDDQSPRQLISFVSSEQEITIDNIVQSHQNAQKSGGDKL